MKKRLLSSVVLTMALSSISTQSASLMHNHQADIEANPAARTEVWEPIPKQLTFNNKNIPSDAIVLFDGSSLDAFTHADSSSVQWEINKGIMRVKPGTGDIISKDSFCDMQMHIEWKTPTSRYREGNQHWGNSGIKIQERYEVQILHSKNSPTYVNGQAASIYKQHPPLVNASLDAGEWQSYDIIYKAPNFDDADQLISPAYITVLHNGVLVQNHAEVFGKTLHVGKPSYEAHGCAPIKLQEHKAAVSFRNIWVRKL